MYDFLQVLLSGLSVEGSVLHFTTQWSCGASFHIALPALKRLRDMA